MTTAAEDSPLSRAVVLFVDMQPVFVGAVPGGAELLRRCQFALAAAHGLGLRVAFTEQVPAKLGGTAPELLAGGKAPKIFAKDAFSALEAEGIRDWLEEHAIEHVLLAGLETAVCIYQTALAAAAEGLQVTLLADCLGGRRACDSATVLDSLAKQGCHVLPSETVFYSILRTTQHPFFREYTKLVKQFAQPNGS